MRLELVKRAEHSTLMTFVSPLIALVLTVVVGAMLFAALGYDPGEALYLYFIDPLMTSWSLQALVVKATPMILIAIGLSFCYLSNNWNVGVEGQFAVGAIFGSAIPILIPAWNGPSVLPALLILGTLGGMFYAAIPALLKIRFHANEILTILLLVYVPSLVLVWLAQSP